MANEEHLKILKQGVNVWNKWREENPEVIPDLTEADLSVANLSDVDLNGADIRGANLFGADLKGAFILGITVPTVWRGIHSVKLANIWRVNPPQKVFWSGQQTMVPSLWSPRRNGKH